MMIRTGTQTQSTTMAPAAEHGFIQHVAGFIAPFSGPASPHVHPRRPSSRLKIWICLLLACVGASWFSSQYILASQSPTRFAPDWHNALWVQATDAVKSRFIDSSPVAYFRYATELDTLPDAASVTIAANQTFRLYVNGVFIGSNNTDIVQGSGLQAYIYDITSALQPGPNMIALRVANLDTQTPSLRASLGIVQGSSISYYGTGPGWQATAQSTLVYPHNTTSRSAWTKTNFDASSWLPVQALADAPASPQLAVNPLLFERPLAPQWMSAGSSHDAYFVRTISLSTDITGAWLRIAATGSAGVFINGQLSISWNGQPPDPAHHTADYLSDQEQDVQYQKGLLVGIYDISPYLHTGNNTVAVHVTAPGSGLAHSGLNALATVLSLDMLISDVQGHDTWYLPGAGWHASPQAAPNWEQGSDATLAWPFPFPVGRPGVTQSLYIPANPTSHNITILPLASLIVVILLSIAAVLGLWLLISLLLKRRYNYSLADALEMMSMACIPALACELLLVALSHEPQIPPPFPYTKLYGLILLLLVALGYLALWLHARHTALPPRVGAVLAPLWGGDARLAPRSAINFSGEKLARNLRNPQHAVVAWLRLHWGLILIILIAIPLICYNLSYEPYWQDELTSYFAAKGILAHGIPVLPSGFFYAKGELYSYVLALSIAIFGDQNAALRIPSVVEYLVSLPLFYYIGCYFFDRRIALLATAMLAFSPAALEWGRSVRMYEQAQLLTILVMFLFYKACRVSINRLGSQVESRFIDSSVSPRLIYLAVACLVLTYLSHEETFIILPALVVCVLVASGRRGGLPAVLYSKHWWFAAFLGGSIIALQLLLAKFTHPPVLGTDQSQQPLIQFTTENFPYYLKLFFFPVALNATLPLITLNSILALAGCIWALRRHGESRFIDSYIRAKYCALFLLVSILTLVLLFTLTSDRYIYPLLPAFYLMGAYALFKGLRAVGTRAVAGMRGWPLWSSSLPSAPDFDQNQNNTQTPLSISGAALSLPMRMVMAFTTILLCASVLILPALPISSYNLFLSRQAGLPYHRHYADYDTVGQYMHAHWQKGDIVIAVSPAISVLYYVGHVDYFFSVDRALYLYEEDGSIVDTPTGSTPLLNQNDFQAVLASHARVWIISDNGLYQAGVTKNGRFTFPPNFHIVFEGYGSAIYFRGG